MNTLDTIKVFHIIDHLGLGGAQTFLLDLALAQKRTGRVQPVLCCLREETALGEKYRQLGLEIDCLNVHPYNPLEIFSIFPRVIRRLKANQIDIVHSHLFVSSLFGRLAALICRVPVVVHEQRNEREHIGLFSTIIERFLGKITSAVICVSKSTRDFIIDVKNIQPKKIWVIPNGIDTLRIEKGKFGNGCDSLIDDNSLAKNRFIVTTVGRLVSEKRIDIFLQASRYVIDQNKEVSFFIVGDGPEMDNLKKMAVDLEITRDVHFVGATSNVFKYLICSHLFVLTSDYEGLPLTILEAMALEVPVIVTDVDGNNEILADGIGGILVPRRDPSAVAREALELLGDAAKRQSLGLNARRIVESRYSLSRIQDQIYQVYLSVSNIRSRLN